MSNLLVCPVCKSTDVELDTGGYTGKYLCKSCGYIGTFILEMSKEDYERMIKEGGAKSS